MATTNNLKKGLNRKLWEACSASPVSFNNGINVISCRHSQHINMLIASATAVYLYNPEEDSYVLIPSPSFGGTFGVGGGGACGMIGPSGTATAGSSTSLTTNISLQRDLRGFKIHITGGTGAGTIVEILRNTLGTNSIISANFGVSIDATSTYRILTPRFYVVNAGSQATGTFKVYCYALNTWSNLSITNFATSISADMRYVSTPSMIGGEFNSFATGTATAATANTLSNTAKSWTTNQWTNSQVRITAGTGAGQVRTISSNTATQLTVSSNWTTTPDATSQYSIEGNDDFIYAIGNSSTTVYRYSISGNTWSTLAAKTSGGNGVSFNWIHSVDDTAWKNESSIINGRRIYSFRGNFGSQLDYYDIASNSWSNDITYAPKGETFSSGCKYVYSKNFIYIQKEGTGRWLRFDLTKSAMEGWHVLSYPFTFAQNETTFEYVYKDGATEVVFIYFGLTGTTLNFRTLAI